MGVSFFTPVQYDGRAQFFGQKLTEVVDDYFYLGGYVAKISGKVRNGSEEVILKVGTTRWWQTAIKVTSYATLIIPMLALVAKVALRSSNCFIIQQNISPATSLQAPIVPPEASVKPRSPFIEKIKNDKNFQEALSCLLLDSSFFEKVKNDKIFREALSFLLLDSSFMENFEKEIFETSHSSVETAIDFVKSLVILWGSFSLALIVSS